MAGTGLDWVPPEWLASEELAAAAAAQGPAPVPPPDPAAAAPPPPPEPAPLPDTWWPSDWVSPDVGLGTSSPTPGASTPAQGGPIGPVAMQAQGAPAAAGGAEAQPGVAPGPTAEAPPFNAGESPFPWEAPESLQPIVDATYGADEPADHDFDLENETADMADALEEKGELAVAEEGVRLENRRRDFIAKGTDDAFAKDSQTREKNALRWRETEATLAKERQDLSKEVAELAKTGVNNDGWWESRSTGQQIAAYVMAIGGGLLAANQGGRNSGLEMIFQAIDKDIESQKYNLAHRRDVAGQKQSALAQLTAQNNDMLRSEEALRLAALENVDQRLAAQAARLDPAGTGAQKIAQARLEVKARQQKARVDAEDRLFKRGVDIHQMKHQDAQLAEQKRARQAAAAESKAGREDANARWAFEHGAVMGPDGKWIPDPSLPQKMDLDTLVKLEQLNVSRERAGKLAAERQMTEAQLSAEKSGPGGSAYAIGDQNGKAYKQKDGKVFEIRDDVTRRKVEDLGQSGQNLTRFVDELKAIREEDGGASAVVGSAQYQRLRSLAQAVDFDTLRANGLGAPTGKDVDLVNAFRGGKDVTSFIYDATPGLEQMLSNTSNRMDSLMRVKGYTGDPVKFERLGPPPEMKNEDAWKTAVTPLSKLTAADPAVRARAIEQRRLHMAGAVVRGEGMTLQQYREADKALKAELASGQLSQEEYNQLDSDLNGLRLTRAAPSGEAAIRKARVRGAGGDLGLFQDDLIDDGEED